MHYLIQDTGRPPDGEGLRRNRNRKQADHRGPAACSLQGEGVFAHLRQLERRCEAVLQVPGLRAQLREAQIHQKGNPLRAVDLQTHHSIRQVPWQRVRRLEVLPSDRGFFGLRAAALHLLWAADPPALAAGGMDRVQF